MCLSLLGCILLATLDTKTSYVYIFRCAHKFIVQKWRNSTGKIKWLRTTMAIKLKYLKKTKIRNKLTPDSGSTLWYLSPGSRRCVSFTWIIFRVKDPCSITLISSNTVDAKNTQSCLTRNVNDAHGTTKTINARFVKNFRNQTARVVATRPISRLKEILISYGPAYWA